MHAGVQDLKICIIGAGISGTTTALALARQGFRNVTVYERAPALGFVGAGIQMAPNMARILTNLGVWEPIADDGVAMEFYSIRGTHHSYGPCISEIDNSQSGRWCYRKDNGACGLQQHREGL